MSIEHKQETMVALFYSGVIEKMLKVLCCKRHKIDSMRLLEQTVNHGHYIIIVNKLSVYTSVLRTLTE